MDSTVVKLFHPVTQIWLTGAFSQPTPAQEMGWPSITSGANTLICAPTGSGKTLAAFLAGIDRIVRDSLESGSPKGVYLLYVSPLKALNYDIERNLRIPLEGIRKAASEMGLELPPVTVGVRTGDTPSKDRAKMARKPPQILITTPESLNLILSSRAGAMLKNVRQVIVDEVHSLAPNKRGAFLSVLLERMEEITARPPVRIGLSATQRPLEETARYLGGYNSDGSRRPVRIIDAGLRKEMRLSVHSALPDFSQQAGGELWPAVERQLIEDINQNRSTIIFSNVRRYVEKLALGINEQMAKRIVEPHHGSISLQRRKNVEERLKSGDLRAVVATSTLELGIDMGSVDLVCQVQSPKSVSSGLQRVGRAGHLYGAASCGKIYSTSLPDLLESAVIAKSMLAGKVERIKAVCNPLDVLAQQIVAMAVHGPIKLDRIYSAVKRSACFHQLGREDFLRTAEMVSGRLGRNFPARVSLDRIRQEISPLPGTLRSIVSGGGTIPDTGQFPVYISGTRQPIGELDEEFVWEAREGEAFRLGTSVWRIEKIETDRIFAVPAPGAAAKLPFWNGEQVWRDSDLGKEIAEFLSGADRFSDDKELAAWIRGSLPVDDVAASNLAGFILRQKESGALPTSGRVVVERFSDALGEERLAIITPYGGRIHHALRIALVEMIRQDYSVMPESFATDDGVLLRLPAELSLTDNILESLTPQRFHDLLESGIITSPLFGLRFRQNAARSLLLTGGRPGKRNPLWLQRLMAKDILQAARGIPDFPAVNETIRECREDYLDADATAELLRGIADGSVKVSISRAATPSPFASSMEFLFNMEFMYVWDRPVGEAARPLTDSAGKLTRLAVSREALARIRDQAERRECKTPAELAEAIRSVGDVTTEEAVARSAGNTAHLLDSLIKDGRVIQIPIARGERWILAEDEAYWSNALANLDDESVWRPRAEAFVTSHPGCNPEDFAVRYGLDIGLAHRAFADLEIRNQAVEIDGQWIDSGLVEAARRITLALKRERSSPVSMEQFQAFVLDWQHLTGIPRLERQPGALEVIEQLAGHPAPAKIWEIEILARRVADYQPGQLDQLLSSGEILWQGVPDAGPPDSITFLPRWLKAGGLWKTDEPEGLPDLERRVLDHLRQHGASFLIDLGLLLAEDTKKIELALLSLAQKGLVTQDGFQILRNTRHSRETPVSASQRRGTLRQRVAQLKRSRPSPGLTAGGRWSALHTQEGVVYDEESVSLAARLLLDRYGILARDIATQAALPFSWTSLYRALERMEMSGEIERGWYVKELGGAQFALREAVPRLRGLSFKDSRPVLVSSCDPALVNTNGLVRRPANYVVLVSGRPALLVETGQKRLVPLTGHEEAVKALGALPSLFDSSWPLRPVRRLDILWWGEAGICDSAVEAELKKIGFERTPRGLVLDG